MTRALEDEFAGLDRTHQPVPHPRARPAPHVRQLLQHRRRVPHMCRLRRYGRLGLRQCRAGRVKLVQRLGDDVLDVIPFDEPLYSLERFFPVLYPDESDTPNTYRSELTGLTSAIEPVGKVVFYPRPA